LPNEEQSDERESEDRIDSAKQQEIARPRQLYHVHHCDQSHLHKCTEPGPDAGQNPERDPGLPNPNRNGDLLRMAFSQDPRDDLAVPGNQIQHLTAQAHHKPYAGEKKARSKARGVKPPTGHALQARTLLDGRQRVFRTLGAPITPFRDVPATSADPPTQNTIRTPCLA
jgi:hypothetical protein